MAKQEHIQKEPNPSSPFPSFTIPSPLSVTEFRLGDTLHQVYIKGKVKVRLSLCLIN
jgi:hypothetical protein